MSVSTEVANQITRITSDRNTIREKLVNLGLAESSATLDDCADAVDSIVNRGAPAATVVEGASYSIQPGYYTGGTVAGVGGGGNYNLQDKEVTPTKSQQSVSSEEGYYGLGTVTVKAIPEAYQDVSSVTAVAGDVLAGTAFVPPSGVLTAGTMPNIGTVNKTLDATTNNQSYTVPAGKHSGSGKVQIVLEEKTATPNTSTQNITPTAGKVLSKVTVNPIPASYGSVASATATAAHILAPYKAVIKNASGNAVLAEGTMVNNGAVSGSVGLATESVIVPAGFTTGGTITLSSDIEEALALI